MSWISRSIQTCNFLTIFLAWFCYGASIPNAQRLKLVNKTCDNSGFCNYYVNIYGEGYLGQQSWRLTADKGSKNEKCLNFLPSYAIYEIRTAADKSDLLISIPEYVHKAYLCLQKQTENGKIWLHQGEDFEIGMTDVSDRNARLYQQQNDKHIERKSNPCKASAELTQPKPPDLLHDVDINNFNNDRESQALSLQYPTRLNVLKSPELVRKLNENKNDVEHFSYRYKRNLNKHNKIPHLDNKDLSTNEEIKNKRLHDIEAIVNIESNGVVTNSLNALKDPSDISYSKDTQQFSDVKTDKTSNDNIEILKMNTQKSNYKDVTLSKVNEADAPVKLSFYEKVEENTTTTKSINSSEPKESVSKEKSLSEENYEHLAKMKFTIPSETLIQANALSSEDQPNNYPAKSTKPHKVLSKSIEERFGNGDSAVDKDLDILTNRRLRRQQDFGFEGETKIEIAGLRVEIADKMEMDIDVPSLLANTEAKLRLFGSGFTDSTVLVFTQESKSYGEKCIFPIPGEYEVVADANIEDTALVRVIAPEPREMSSLFFICIRKDSNSPFLHQGSESWKTILTHKRPLPLWATILLISVCLMFSALFSGLNLGLMSLDRTELKIIANTGTENERKYARTIAPIRDHGNFLLCSILLGNVAVNSTFTILLDGLTSGLFAVIFSTLAIVIMGEIIPQAICSRYGLAIGAKTIVLMKAVMGITSPLAYPVSRLLDCVLGEEIGNVYNRDRLKELVKVTNDVNDLDKDEVNIISGALELRKKTVKEVMTKIEDAFMLDIDSILGFETMSEIVKSGFSRIPVYEENRTNIVTVLFIKDLAFVDPDDNTPLRTLCQYYQNPCNFVFEDVTLDIMFKQFKEGNKGHMAFVHRVNNEGEGDPFYETIGLITLEDVIEELIQAEIVDETDVFTDNKSKRRRKTNKLKDFAAFAEKRENQRFRISPQLTLATYQYMSTLDAFKPDSVSETVLRRLLRQDIVRQAKGKGKDRSDPASLIYVQGKPVDYFVLILEGRVEVTVGREGLVFEAGPFTYFGIQSLTQNVGGLDSPTSVPSTMGSLQNINLETALRYSFIPDYSVRAVCDTVYITIKRSLYLAAKRATLMEKTSSLTKSGVAGAGEMFDKEVDKLLQSLDEDASIGGGDAKTPSRQISPNPQTIPSSHQRGSISSPGRPTDTPRSDSLPRDSKANGRAPEATSEDSEPDEESKLLS